MSHIVWNRQNNVFKLDIYSSCTDWKYEWIVHIGSYRRRIRNGLKIMYLIWNQVVKHGRRPAELRRCRNRHGSWLEIYMKIEDFVRCYDSRHEKSEKFMLFISPSSSPSEIRRNWKIFLRCYGNCREMSYRSTLGIIN
jgi:hypothetical protein